MIDREEFKSASGRFVTGVTVVTSVMEDVYYGLTANSFTSVSLSPPIISICISKESSTLRAIKKSGHFNISILSIGQEDIANIFASKDIDKFKNTNYLLSKLNHIPYIDNVCSVFENRLYKIYNSGDHDIILGLVEKLTIDKSKKPLIYFEKSYKNFI